MGKTITLNFSSYQDRHHFSNQENIVSCIPINPVLREDFDITPHSLRDKKELDDWWGRPYIKIHQNTRSHLEENWLARWPAGVRFDVRCLDGKKEDRSTVVGSYESLEIAMLNAMLLSEQES